MSKFENLTTKVVVSVDDSKDERFASGWKPVSECSESNAWKTAAAAKPSE